MFVCVVCLFVCVVCLFVLSVCLCVSMCMYLYVCEW
jgi:hypothetical protein